MGKNKFRLSQRKQHRRHAGGDLPGSSTKSVGTQTDDILTATKTSGGTGLNEHLEHLMSPMPGSCIVQIPIDIFFSQRFTTLNQLQARLASLKCIGNWFLLSGINSDGNIQLVRVGSNQEVMSLVITNKLEWSLHISNCWLSSSAKIFQHLPSVLSCIKDLHTFTTFIESCRICKGNGDPKFAPLVARNKGTFMDRSGK